MNRFADRARAVAAALDTTPGTLADDLGCLAALRARGWARR